VGTLSYNGVKFSSLYKSVVRGKVVQDDAKWTTKYVEYSIEVEGFVTLAQGEATTDNTFEGLRLRLSAAGQALQYTGKGFGDLVVNLPTGVFDVAYGPAPQVVSFTPLGAARGAQVAWTCVTRIPEVPFAANQNPPSLGSPLSGVASAAGQVLQFSYSASIGYDDEYYGTVSLKGILEIAASRTPAGGRLVKKTVDSFRRSWLNIPYDRRQYRCVSRRFDESEDQRSCTWSYELAQLPPAGLPVGAPKAGGRMSIRPLRPGGGKEGKPVIGPFWACTLRCTYSIRADFERRTAFFAFMSLLWFRMWSSLSGVVPDLDFAGQQLQAVAKDFLQNALLKGAGFTPPNTPSRAISFYTQLAGRQNAAGEQASAILGLNQKAAAARPVLMDFGVDEGVYDDAKSISFQASWRTCCTFQSLLYATGVWRFGPEVGGLNWAESIVDVSGWRGPLANNVNPAAEVIVDFGGGTSLTAAPVAPGSGV
jgi:hypothetical protein